MQLVCIATGNSPIGTYNRLEKTYKNHPEYFKEICIVKLDEWGGLNDDDPNSCEYYIKQKILQPLHIKEKRYISFKSDEEDSQAECDRIQKQVDARGPIDICILGLGKMDTSVSLNRQNYCQLDVMLVNYLSVQNSIK